MVRSPYKSSRRRYKEGCQGNSVRSLQQFCYTKGLRRDPGPDLRAILDRRLHNFLQNGCIQRYAPRTKLKTHGFTASCLSIFFSINVPFVACGTSPDMEFPTHLFDKKNEIEISMYHELDFRFTVSQPSHPIRSQSGPIGPIRPHRLPIFRLV